MARIDIKEAFAGNKLLQRYEPVESKFIEFKEALVILKNDIDNKSRESFIEDRVTELLLKTFYESTNFVGKPKQSNIDLVILDEKSAKSDVRVIFEAKKLDTQDFPTADGNINVKALHESIYYYLQESLMGKQNKDVRRIVITEGIKWFIFDAQDFELLFVKNKELKRQFDDFTAGISAIKKTEDLYHKIGEIIAPIINKLDYIYFDISQITEDKDFLVVYKILSPHYLLKKPCATDSNILNKGFYNELLYIIGLREKEINNKIVIEQLPEKERESGSLIENAIVQLGYDSSYNLFDRAIQLVIVWINRILFLKLLEAQLVKWHDGDESYKFLTIAKLKEYDTLKKLFFGVLARRPEERDAELTRDFKNVPYLNSSLFEKTEELSIAELADDVLIKVYDNTVLNVEKGTKMRPLEYLLQFLDAYDFGAVKSENGCRKENKTIINASVLGLIFEKINGYKDGSFFTPGTITQYMCHESIRRAVVEKFNEAKKWNCENYTELKNLLAIEKTSIKERNDIINSLKICDPAVGSGHFLVSALNELIYIKYELNALCLVEGNLHDGKLEIENDELVISRNDGKIFSYNPNDKYSQKMQEGLFNEKRAIIENCLFGVDINPNSVNICRLRLWIELLKNAYYYTDNKGNHSLMTLPNIDINIKCGNSLVGKYPVKIGQSIVNNEIKADVTAYKKAVFAYKKESNKQAKHEVENKIEAIKKRFTEGIQFDLFDDSIRQKAIEESVYRNSMEWMIEFPEVLNDEGCFKGFDVVIGNPPYIYNRGMDDSKRTSKGEDSDDFYISFIKRGELLLAEKGYLSYITPNTYLTNISKADFRKWLLEKKDLNFTYSGYCFDDAYVETEILLFNKKHDKNTPIHFYSTSQKYDYSCNRSVFLSNYKCRLFLPTETNLSLYEKIMKPLIPICNTYENAISGKDAHIDLILNSLKEYNILPIGVFCEGAQGLVTGNNSKYLTQICCSAEEERKIEDELLEKYTSLSGENVSYEQFSNNKNEFYDKCEFLKIKKVKPDLFGKKFIYKTTDKSNVLSYNELTENEKRYGGKNGCLVEYYRGNKEGFTYYLPSNYCIDWSSESLKELREGIKTNSRWQGEKYFNSIGFAWVDYFTDKVKSFCVESGPYSKDVVKLHSVKDSVPDKYIVAILNSTLNSYLCKNFITATHTLQINDGRLIPIVVPNREQSESILNVIEQILAVKKQDPKADTSELENNIDDLVFELYGLSPEEIAVVKG